MSPERTVALWSQATGIHCGTHPQATVTAAAVATATATAAAPLTATAASHPPKATLTHGAHVPCNDDHPLKATLLPEAKTAASPATAPSDKETYAGYVERWASLV